MDENWEQFVIDASNLISNRENYQRTLGKLASDIAEKYGSVALDDFSKAIEESHGLHISPSTLRNYLWVHQKTASLDLPEDLSYRTLQYIASSGDPAGWAQRIKEEGLSSPEIFRIIREAKGLTGKKKEVICPNCGNKFEI